MVNSDNVCLFKHMHKTKIISTAGNGEKKEKKYMKNMTICRVTIFT